MQIWDENYTKTKRTGFRRKLEIKGTEKQKIITEFCILKAVTSVVSITKMNQYGYYQEYLASDMSSYNSPVISAKIQT